MKELETQLWLKFNDSSVTEMKEEEFEKAGYKESYHCKVLAQYLCTIFILNVYVC